MSDPEFNKIFAAVLVAGIVAMFGGFLAEQLIHTETPEKDAVAIEGGEIAVSGPVKATEPEPILHLIASAEISQGEKLSKACAACHSFNKDGPHRVGPNLWRALGAPIASKSGFDYSDALQTQEGSWDYMALNKFLWKPKKFAPGTNMNYIGLKNPEKRAALIAWLRTLGSESVPLPGEADIAREQKKLNPPEGEGSEPNEK